MDEAPHLPGVTSSFVDTPRLRQHVLSCGPEDGIPIIFVHGNFSACTYWEELMLQMAPEGFRCLAPDLRGYGWTEDRLIDARQGFGDFSRDLAELVDALGLDRFHMVGWSLGGGILLRYPADHPGQVLSITLQAPVSPYGFGGTRDLAGTPCYPDFAGSGGGTVNPEFVRRIMAGDRTADDPNSPRNVISAFYYKAPFKPAREEDFLTAALREKTGPERYPGDYVASPNWPNVAPGVWGPINAGAPPNVAGDVDRLLATEPKPAVLWIRGADDQIVSDMSFFDFGTLGKLGFVPGWPGDEVFPPQPMVSQTRAVLEQYAAAGGSFREVVLENCGHAPHIEHPDRWLAEFRELVQARVQ